MRDIEDVDVFSKGDVFLYLYETIIFYTRYIYFNIFKNI